MTNEEFKSWLLGYVVLTQNLPLTEQRIQIIKNHACLVNEIDGFINLENQMIMKNLVVNQGLGHLFETKT